MAGEDARLKAGLKSAEDELNLIKNQIQQTLLDIREHILDVTNPFNNMDAANLDDDDEEINIEEVGGGAAGAVQGAGDGAGASDDEIIEEEGPMEEAFEDEIGTEELLAGDDAPGDMIEEIGGDEIMGGGGGGGGGMGDLMDPLAELAEPEEEDVFELDDDSEGDEADALTPDEDEKSMPGSEADSGAEPDSVGNAVSAALTADLDLLTLASLVRWVSVTRNRLGGNRLDILLDAYELAGRISPQMRMVITTLSALDDDDGDGIPVRDVVTAMVRMEGVLNSGPARESSRLLGLLLEMDDDPLDRLVA